MYVVSDSILFFRRGGARSKSDTILTEVATFLGKTTKGFVLKDIVCIKGAKGKGFSGEVDRIMQLAELAPPGCNYFGLGRRAVLIVFWNCNGMASQSTTNKPRWTEARGANGEFPNPMFAGPGLGQTWGLNNNFDEGAARLYSSFALSAVPYANDDSMYVTAARSDLWHAGNT